MADLHRTPTTPKAGKNHVCVACQHSIPTGEVHKLQTGLFDGRAYRNRYHFECWDELTRDLVVGERFEVFPGDIQPPKRLIEV